jgi:hypothetical protein
VGCYFKTQSVGATLQVWWQKEFVNNAPPCSRDVRKMVLTKKTGECKQDFNVFLGE